MLIRTTSTHTHTHTQPDTKTLTETPVHTLTHKSTPYTHSYMMYGVTRLPRRTAAPSLLKNTHTHRALTRSNKADIDRDQRDLVHHPSRWTSTLTRWIRVGVCA
eukprot:GHVU01126311.1.p2 GENE.GHVU01126311.1~~GHVU01126311.1.p2  ORF type:complete len:104 (+),score=4.79 GHVU01126311.1:351-662(+)